MAAQSNDRIKIPTSFWRDLPKIGIKEHELIHRAKLPVNILSEPVIVTTDQYFAIWQAVLDLIEDPATGILSIATDVKTTQLPPSILAAYHARSYREALNRMARYKQLCSPERIIISEEGEICTIELEWLYSEFSEPPMLAGVIMATLLEIGRLGTGQPLTAHYVEFSDSMGKKHILEDYFGCEVRYGSQQNKMTLKLSDLDRLFDSYNAELLEILTPALDLSLDEQQRRNSITETVKSILKHNLSSGRPDINKVAGELSISERTLQRRLTGAGTNFKDLLAETRHEMARDYLVDPSLDIKEVAFLLGYEELNSFYRAFRHWEGETPSNWRTEHLSSNSMVPPFH
ncbi:AraC family transcriptional regulator [Terribacillus saccharophilus]|uniref:AraC family transcriptional regulator n=1 Tax=Terribacillus saccharophilus TaxID=361277 RepID=A0ABX4H369_9BACI|nr:AraC family transcriptional regulator [Terribacillus saccharophilus]PAD37158.1 AraC family transcriptional regulator [Terribacillus saccharophilus]PAD97402.1 AraC family transcriptional regulator [Terribacillus saccharophilus]PAE01450.1 AraC family transcriptional regulator [Terribacillus saccharophilus]